MSTDATPSWVLISVLFSTFPLTEGLTRALYQVAVDLYQHGQGQSDVDFELAHGQVKNCQKEAAIGSITGPVFEAVLETERGQAQVNFILTRQGLSLLGEGASPSRGPQYLN